jgi:hypothetical protein
MCRPPETVDQLSKVLVLGEENTAFGEGTGQDLIVGCATQRLDGIQYIMAIGAQDVHHPASQHSSARNFIGVAHQRR